MNRPETLLRIINAAEVRRLLSMPRCIDLMAEAMEAASRGQIAIPQRLISPLIDQSAYLALMPGSTLQPRMYCVKVISVHPKNPARGLPGHQGFVSLFDHDIGVPVAIIEGSQITAIRTAAASGLATRTLARADARTHGVFGAGVQAATHVEAIAAVRTIERVLVWTRAPTKAEAFAAELRERMSCEVLVTSDPAEAAASDIVTTATSASEPILRGAWLRPGSHVNVVGAHSPKTREVDDDVVRRCTIYVDLMQSAMSEAGDLLIPIGTGVITQDDIVGEIGQVLVGDVAGRNDATQITLYKSLGVVAQDLFAGAHVYRAACEQGVGSLLSL